MTLELRPQQPRGLTKSGLKLAVLAAIVAPALVARATTLGWDADPVTSGAQHGSGTWSATANNWWDGAANVLWNDAMPDVAIFGTNNLAAGAVTVSGIVTNGGMTFNSPRQRQLHAGGRPAVPQGQHHRRQCVRHAQLPAESGCRLDLDGGQRTDIDRCQRGDLHRSVSIDFVDRAHPQQ